METFVIVIIAGVLSLISAIIKKQQEGKGGPGPGGPEKPQSNWAEELRRMLEGEEIKPPTPARRPPVVVQKTAPPPPVKPRPAPKITAPRPAMADVERSAGQLAPMRESQDAYNQASQLDETVSRHIASVPGQPVGSTVVTRRETSAEAAGAIVFFKNARSARQAVLVSVIFGPPKALDDGARGFHCGAI